MSRFIDCISDSNLFALVITGEPGKEELQRSWDCIYEEFHKEIGGAESRMHENLYRQVTMLALDYQILHVALENLELRKGLQDDLENSQYAKFVNDTLKTSYVFNGDDENFDKYISKCRTRSGAMKISLDLKQATFEGLQNKEAGKVVEMDRKYWIGQFVALSDHAKVMVPDSITAREYCIRVKNINDHFDKLNNSDGGGKDRRLR